MVHVLSSDPQILVVGIAQNGEEALEFVQQTSPDVVTMDIHMPKLNGVEATRRIMETRPTPIVIVSGISNATEAATAFQAMEAGALAVVQMPMGINHPEHAHTVAVLLETVKLMSEVKVVKRWARERAAAASSACVPPVEVELPRKLAEIKLIALGTSTGGPPVLQTILSRLPPDFRVPILIVQHMAPGFIEAFVEWLGQTSNLPVHLGREGEPIKAGHVYVAPDGCQMQVMLGGKISLTREAPENGLLPSVSYLFRSVAKLYGHNAVGILLTGMGKDGARELKLMKEKGAATIAQDRETSVVYGMPGEAVHLGAATYVLSPERIVVTVQSLVNGK